MTALKDLRKLPVDALTNAIFDNDQLSVDRKKPSFKSKIKNYYIYTREQYAHLLKALRTEKTASASLNQESIADLGYIKLYAQAILKKAKEDPVIVERNAETIIELVQKVMGREKTQASLQYPVLAKLFPILSAEQFSTVQEAINRYYYEPDVAVFISSYMHELPEQLASEGQKAWDMHVAIQQSLNKYARGDKPAYDGMTQEQIDNAKAKQEQCLKDYAAYNAAAEEKFKERNQG